MNKANRELIAYIGYLNGKTKDPIIQKETGELLKQYWTHPKENEQS